MMTRGTLIKKKQGGKGGDLNNIIIINIMLVVVQGLSRLQILKFFF